MILEALGIFKIFEWMTGSGQQRQLATPPQPYRSDKVVETIDVPGGGCVWWCGGIVALRNSITWKAALLVIESGLPYGGTAAGVASLVM